MDELTLRVFNVLREHLDPIGEIELVGSARSGKAFNRNHDFDIKFTTRVTSKILLMEKLKKTSSAFHLHTVLPLHVFVVGDFTPEYIIDNRNVTNKLMVHFDTPVGHIFLRYAILFGKFINMPATLFNTVKSFIKDGVL